MAIPSKTVGDLVASIAFDLTNSTTVDTELASQIKENIGYVIYDLVKASRMPAFRKSATLTTVAGTSNYDMPDDFQSVIDPGPQFNTSPYNPLMYFEQQDYVQENWASRYSSNAKPIHYTMRSRDATDGLWQMKLVPTPDAEYTIDYDYFSDPVEVNSSTSDATEIDPRFPRDQLNGIRYGVAICFPQFIGADQMQLYSSKYAEARKAIRKNQSAVTGHSPQHKAYRRGADLGGGRNIGQDILDTTSPIR